MNFSELYALIEEEMQATNEIISNALNSKIALIKQLTTHLLQSGGKRLRPLIVLLVARAFHYNQPLHTLLAAIIELIHTATLLHDDVVDNSQLRRSQKTANAIWGNPASVLVGDFLYSRSFQMMVSLKNSLVMEILAQATNEISQGEILQLCNLNNIDLTEDTYLEIITAKTGTLFASAAQLSCLISNGTPQEIEGLKNYGKQLGIAFQLIDDMLDYNASSANFGKSLGADLREGKFTLPLIFTLKKCSNSQKKQLTSIISEGGAKIEKVVEIMTSVCASQYVTGLAQHYAKEAKLALQCAPCSIYQQALIDLADLLIERSY